MRFLRSGSQSVIGLDIGTHSLKLVELGGSLTSPRVLAWGVAPTPDKAFAENAIADIGRLADAVQSLIIRSGAKSDTVAVAISSSHAITKVLGMPSDMRDVDLEEQVSIEALHFVPYPIDEVNIDFEVIGPSSVNPDENDVLLVACRRSIVDDCIDLVEASDLALKYVDIDTYALERVARAQARLVPESQDPVALFDVGSQSSHLMLMDSNRVVYSRHQNFGAAQLIKLIRREYGVNADEAEGILNSAQLPGDFNTTVQTPFAEQLHQEINRALQFFYSSSPHSAVDSVILSGRCSALEGLCTDLERQMRIKVTALNPFSGARIMSNRSAAHQHYAALSTAYGLSMRGLS